MPIKDINKSELARSFSMTRNDINEDERTIEVAFSSEEPVERWFGLEILDHSPEAVRLDRLANGGAVLMDHNHRDQVGVIESVKIDGDRRGRATLRFGKSARANEVFTDVKEGIRSLVSVGYRIHQWTETKTEAGVDEIRATDWEPYEISIVAVPADATVGVGRSSEPAAVETDDKPQPKKREKESIMPKSTEAPAVVVDHTEAVTQERARIAKIQGLARKFDCETEAKAAIDSGRSAELFAQDVLEMVGSRKTETAETTIDLSTNEIRRYSLLRAIQAQVKGDWRGAEFELEASLAVAEKLGRDARGFFVPFDVLASRAMTVGGAGTGAEMVGTDHLAGSFIDNLRAELLCAQLGAQFVTGLVGDLDIPGKASSATFAWIAEDGTNTQSDVGTRSVAMAPKTVAGATYMSRRLLKQSDPSVENMVMADLVKGAALAIDAAALNGGGANEPTGILQVAGVGTVTAADTVGKKPTFGELVDLESAVAEANALRNNLHYVTTPSLFGALKQAKKDAGSGEFVIAGGEANGYGIHRTTNLPALQTIFGNFNDLMIGMWGVLDINVDDKTSANKGGLNLWAYQDADVAVRHGASFAKIV